MKFRFLNVLLTTVIFITTSYINTANAGLMTWNFDNVTDGHGHSIVGQFSYDTSAGTFSNIDLTMMDGISALYTQGSNSGDTGWLANGGLRVDFYDVKFWHSIYLQVTEDIATTVVTKISVTDGGYYYWDTVTSSSIQAFGFTGFLVLDTAVNGPSASSQVPEPSTLAIFALGVMGLASRRFKKQS